MDIIKLYQEDKKSTKEIGKLLGCHSKTIWTFLKKNNIPLRNRSEAKTLEWEKRSRNKKRYYCALCQQEKSKSKAGTLCKRCYQSSSVKKKGKESSSWRGGKPTCEKCHHQLSTYSSRSKTHLCRTCHNKISGMAHWNWKGGISKRSLTTKKYKNWRQSVLERDNYTCKKCGSKDDLHVHHIIRWTDNVELRYDINNGLALCSQCHYKLHWAT